MFNILVVEDNNDLREMYVTALNRFGYKCFGASDGLQAFDLLEKETMDLIIADIMMPNMDGLELTKELRKYGDNNTPIIIVTARDDFNTIEKSFEYGADDYMVKPVNINELILRIKAILRRAKINSEKKIHIGSTVLDFEKMTVSSGDLTIELPLKEFRLLFMLLSYPDKIFTRQQIMDEVWGLETETDDRTINTHINRLREKFETNPDFEILTIRGLGYKGVKKHE